MIPEFPQNHAIHPSKNPCSIGYDEVTRLTKDRSWRRWWFIPVAADKANPFWSKWSTAFPGAEDLPHLAHNKVPSISAAIQLIIQSNLFPFKGCKYLVPFLTQIKQVKTPVKTGETPLDRRAAKGHAGILSINLSALVNSSVGSIYIRLYDCCSIFHIFFSLLVSLLHFPLSYWKYCFL